MQESSSERGTDLAGGLPIFPQIPGAKFGDALSLPDFRRKRLLFNHFELTQSIHIYQADCRAGARLRVQMIYPLLKRGRTAQARFAVIAQSLPYSADQDALPIPLPAGFRAVVAPQMSDWTISPHVDMLTAAEYYLGPVIDTQVLVGGRCYIVVWIPDNRPGRYILQIGHRWPLRWSYWNQLPMFWWKIRGWFGLSRIWAYLLLGGLAISLLVGWLVRRNRAMSRAGSRKSMPKS
ncbi:MAG: hypothetical protein AAF702_20805 [Chloroflexota bacterium]